MKYRIKYVDDAAIDGKDFVLCRHGDGVTFFIRRGVRNLSDAENAAMWMAAWDAFRGMAQVDVIPPQRVYAMSM